MRKYFLQLLIVFSLLLSFCCHVHASSVTGAYRDTGAVTVNFDVNISSPPPSSLIIQHYHPANAKVKVTSPAAGKTDNSKGYVKWFVKNPQPGKFGYSITFSKPQPRDNYKLVIRFKDPLNGIFQEIKVYP